MYREAIERIYAHPLFKSAAAKSKEEAIRERINDHSIKHFEIVREFAEKVYLLLKESSVGFDIECSEEERRFIIASAALLHDIGMALGRRHHEVYSVFFAKEILDDVLAVKDKERKYSIIFEVLNIISNHRSSSFPSTLEGEIVRLADALDISHGRAKIPYLAPDDIHKISAEAIKRVEVVKGKKRAVRLIIEMKNASGMYLVTNFLRAKIGKKIAPHLEIFVVVEESSESYDFSPYAFK